MHARYDREVNNGHRSAIKKILEGNALPSLMMVLCISAIYSHPDVNKLEAGGTDGNENSIDKKSLLAAKRNMPAHIELTDGWYVVASSLLSSDETERYQQFSVSAFSQVCTRNVIRRGTFRTTTEKKAFYRTKASGTILFSPSLLVVTRTWL